MRKERIRTEHVRCLESLGLAAEKLEEIEIRIYEKGEFVSREGEQLSSFFVVLSGEAKVFCDMENGRRLLISFYEAGGIIGDIELMTRMEGASASVRALSDFACIAIPVSHANVAYMKSNARFLSVVGENLSRKLERSSKNSAHIILYPLEERLCSYIDVTNENGVFAEKLTEVAEVLGTSYRHLLRELNRLVESGVLEKQGKTYYVRMEEELKTRSRDFYRPVERMSVK